MSSSDGHTCLVPSHLHDRANVDQEHDDDIEQQQRQAAESLDDSTNEVEVVGDDDEGRDTVENSLHGLEKQMSIGHLDHAANFTDYLKAQRSLQSFRYSMNHRSSLVAQTSRSGSITANAGAGAGAGAGAPMRSSAGRMPSVTGQEGQEQEQSQAVGGIRRRTSASAAANRTSAISNGATGSAQQPPARTEQERRTLRRLTLIGRRASTANVAATNDTSAANDVAWENIFNELAEIDEDGHFHDGEDHIIPWYSPPVQRQRWGQDQILPHINWGDLFFDLFYVAAAYNLGVMLTSGMNPQDWPRGVIYFIGTFGPMYGSWETSMYYSSRYTVVDYAHRLFEVIRFLFVSVAVLHIKPLPLMADPKSSEVLTFTLAVVLESMMHFGLNCELYFKGQGDRAAIQNHTSVKMKNQLLPTLLVYFAAFVVAVVQYAQPADGYSRRLAAASDTYGSAYDTYAGANEPRWVLSDLPLTLTAIAYLQNIFFTTWRKMRATSGKHGDIRQRFVPNNVDYVIHRYGEWILLMIGEGILSLLIVETTESGDYYIITTFGVLTVIFLQVLKFESEPSHAESHAMWRSMRNAMCYGYLIQILSMSLICFGVSYKVFLQDILKTEKEEKVSDYESDKTNPGRLLAPAVEVSDDATAALFAGSLFVVLVSLELMTLTHSGVKQALGRLFHSKEDGQMTETRRRPYWPVVIIATVKLGLMLFTVTLNQWTADPAVLTLCGFAIVVSLALTRVLGWAFIHRREAIDKAAETVVSTVRNLKPSVSFAPSLSATGEKALESSSIHSSGSIDADKRSDGGSTSTRGTASTDLVRGGIDNSFDAIVVADLKGIIKQVNTTGVKIFGYADKAEMIGKNLTIIVGGDEGKRHDAYVKGFSKRVGSKSSVPSKILGQQRILQAKRADGTEFPCIIGIKLCADDTRIVGYIRDMSGVVSDEKSKLTADMTVEQAIERVVDDHAFDAIIASDSRGIIQRVNETAVVEFGYDDKDDLVGENISTLIHGVVGHPELLMDSHGEQRVVTLTRKDGVEFESIIATTNIKGTGGSMVASYIRNVDLVKHSFKCEKCD
mmetsp:Transcript_13831/g.30079  ORF Transcript_13831/g.30079 Transcript_13831/m.30079 type:complete len:1067 (+) Transcript_13831:294-3494(+)